MFGLYRTYTLNGNKFKVFGKGRPVNLKERGKISNYRFTCDYVLGPIENIYKPLTIFRSNDKNISEESKSVHELVYEIFKKK